MREFTLVVCWIGVLQALLLSGFFLTTVNKNYTRLFLGLALLLSSIRSAKSTLFVYNEVVSQTILNIGFAAHAMAAPVLLLYVLSLRKDFAFNALHWLHFIPGLLILLFSPVLNLDSFWYRGGYTLLLLYTLIYIITYVIHFVFLYRTEKNNQRISLRWVSFLLLTFTLFLLAYFANYILRVTSYSAAPITYSILIFFISYIAIWNNNLFTHQQRKKYQNLNLSSEALKEYAENIVRVMDQNKHYLNPNFTVQMLSAESTVPSYAISFVMSEILQTNFTQLVNTYRIEEAKKLLLDPSKDYLSIAGIAYECGFNTLSSFNSAFKKINHITPSEFRKR